jgi:catechol 2,3-dioxygenase-like lactoylglutathione lyase family enzyme
MFDHVTLRVSDFDASRAFYTTALGTLGVQPGHVDGGFAEWADFSLIVRSDEPATANLHVAFAARDRAHVDAFWRALTAAGFRDDGAPGPRPEYAEGYYGAFVLDPDGNSAEAVHFDPVRADGLVDHLWLRVADVGESRRFYEAVAPLVGLEVRGHAAEGVHFAGTGMSISCVAGERRTENLHVAFTVADNGRVDAFHAAGLAVGFRDNGGPGERPYHPGYYGAFLLDPDGNNIEAVCHNR